MDFHVLGPLRVVHNGTEVDVRGAKERTLLQHLVARAGQVVPATDLIDSLWPHDPPRSAAKSLQTYVLRLRNALEPERSGEPRGAGHGRVRVPPRRDGAGHGRRPLRPALGAGSPGLGGRAAQAALDASRDALALWRGPAYAGCEDTVFGPAEARRLGELRLLTEEARLEAMLALGQEGAAVPEIERQVTDHPLRERLWELLMLASYRSGRQGAALEAYDRARAVLAEELGVDPGPGLGSCTRGCWPRTRTWTCRAPGPAPRRAAPQHQGGGRPRARAGRPAGVVGADRGWRDHLVLVRGPAGAGASRLAAVLAEEVAETGHPVLFAGRPRLRRSVAPCGRGHPGDPEPGARCSCWAAGCGHRRHGDGRGPRSAGAVRRAADGGDQYAGPAEAEALAAVVLAAGPAWPGRVHAEAARIVRERPPSA